MSPDGVASNAVTFTVEPVPAITSLSPPSVVCGVPSFNLTVIGANFTTGAVVNWNGAALATTFVSTGRLTVVVPAADVVVAGTPSAVTVTSVDGIVSAPSQFTISPLHTFQPGLQMISSPYDYTGDPIDTILDFGVTTNWAVWDPVANVYDLTPLAPAETLHQGRGAWVDFKQATSIVMRGTDRTAQSKMLTTVPLAFGWNMIGDPGGHTVPVPMANMRIVDSQNRTQTLTQANLFGTVYSVLYGFDGSNYVSVANDSIQPYTGYWMLAFAPCTLEIPSPNGNNPH